MRNLQNAFAALLWALGLLFGAAGVEMSALAAGSFTGTVTILHVNDVHTSINETAKAIGYAKIAGFAAQMKAKNPNTLFLDGGDSFSGTENAAVDNAVSLVPILNSVGFDAMVTGNNDYPFGTDHLLKLAGMVNYPVLCANMVKKDSGKPILPGYRIFTLANGTKAAVIGLTTPVSAAMGAADLMYVNALEAGRKLVNELKPQADVIIGLFHVGDTEGDPMTSVMLAKGIPGLDVIIDGHSHTRLPEGRMEGGILIAQTGEYGENIGVIDLTYENGRLVGSKARLISRKEADGLPVKAETARLIADFNVMSSKHFAQVVGETKVELVGARNLIRTKETNLGSFYADVMRKAAGADVGMFKAGPIGGQIPPGPITRKDLVAIARSQQHDNRQADVRGRHHGISQLFSGGLSGTQRELPAGQRHFLRD